MIRKKREDREIVIDLTGPEGNAFALIGYARKLGRQMGFDTQRIEKLQEEMMSGDYENLLQVFDREFGKYVILER
jgi:hypothetical protein